jgi:hypothetical protein
MMIIVKDIEQEHTYFLIIEISGAIIGFSKHMALIKISGKDCSSSKDPYITTSAVLRTDSEFKSPAISSMVPFGYFKLCAIVW